MFHKFKPTNPQADATVFLKHKHSTCRIHNEVLTTLKCLLLGNRLNVGLSRGKEYTFCILKKELFEALYFGGTISYHFAKKTLIVSIAQKDFVPP